MPESQVSITLHIAVLNERAFKGPCRHHKNVPPGQKHKNIMVLLSMLPHKPPRRTPQE